MNTRAKTYTVAVMLAVALLAGIIFGLWVLTNHTVIFFCVLGALIVLGGFTSGFVTILQARGWK